VIVSGQEDYHGPSKRYIYSAGIYTELLPPGWQNATAKGINNDGVVIGGGNDGDSQKGFIYRNGTYTEILPPGWNSATAYGINNNGVVVGGENDDSLSGGKAFAYHNGTYTELLPPGWQMAIAYAINDNGVVVGWGMEGEKQKGFIATPKIIGTSGQAQ
jgi:probable HAF family extracellular repeat protein